MKDSFKCACGAQALKGEQNVLFEGTRFCDPSCSALQARRKATRRRRSAFLKGTTIAALTAASVA